MKMYNTIKRLTAGCFILLLCLTGVPCSAQESLMQDISWPYLEKLIATAKEAYPKVKTFDTRIDIARAGVTKAKMSYFDIISLSYLYNPSNSGLVNPNLNTNFLYGYQLGLFVNIGGILQRPFIVRQAKEEKKLAEQEKEVYDLSIEAEVQKRYFMYIQELSILRIHAQSLLDAESLLKHTRYRFEKGEEHLDAYSKILIMFADHQTQKIKAEAAVLIAKSSLEELLGTKLETIQ